MLLVPCMQMYPAQSSSALSCCCCAVRDVLIQSPPADKENKKLHKIYAVHTIPLCFTWNYIIQSATEWRHGFLACSHTRFSHIPPSNTMPADPSITNNFMSAHLRHQLMVQKYVGTLDIPVDQRLLKCRVKVHNASCCVHTYAETGLPLQCRFLILGARQVKQKYHYCFSNSVCTCGGRQWGACI